MSEVGCRARSSENTTSSALNELPLWNLTPWRSLNSHTVGSPVTFQETASVGCDLAGVVAQQQRLVDLVQQVVGRPLVLGVRVEREGIARAGPLQRAGIGPGHGKRQRGHAAATLRIERDLIFSSIVCRPCPSLIRILPKLGI